jgi:hypothetical protein
MTQKPENQAMPGDEHWYEFLTTGATDLEKRGRRFFGHLPDNPRCKACNAPPGPEMARRIRRNLCPARFTRLTCSELRV